MDNAFSVLAESPVREGSQDTKLLYSLTLFYIP
jgi:hypothetical protein